MTDLVFKDARIRILNLHQQLLEIYSLIGNREYLIPKDRFNEEQNEQINNLSKELSVALDNMEEVIELISEQGFDDNYVPGKVPELDELVAMCLDDEKKILALNEKFK